MKRLIFGGYAKTRIACFHYALKLKNYLKPFTTTTIAFPLYLDLSFIRRRDSIKCYFHIHLYIHASMQIYIYIYIYIYIIKYIMYMYIYAYTHIIHIYYRR